MAAKITKREKPDTIYYVPLDGGKTTSTPSVTSSALGFSLRSPRMEIKKDHKKVQARGKGLLSLCTSLTPRRERFGWLQRSWGRVLKGTRRGKSCVSACKGGFLAPVRCNYTLLHASRLISLVNLQPWAWFLVLNEGKITLGPPWALLHSCRGRSSPCCWYEDLRGLPPKVP